DGIRDFSRDWSSDVCSSDLQHLVVNRDGADVEIDLPVNILDKLATEREQDILPVAPRIPLIVSVVPEDSHNKDALQPGDFITARSEERRVGKGCRYRCETQD